MLVDNHQRPIHYLRLAVTDRCNLRCFYCMPAAGIKYIPKKELLTFEEIERLVTLLAGMGITKLRITGGEPFVRTDLMQLLERLVAISGIREVHLTTNGVLTAPHVPRLKDLGIASVNLSLDTLDAQRFQVITRRNEFEPVMRTLDALLKHEIPVKLNAVVMENKNIDDIHSMVDYTRDHPVSVRFIEEMPFNGEGNHYPRLHWNHTRILSHIREAFPNISKVPDPPFSTATHYQIPGHLGDLGIIAAFSRTFCGSCNRIRVTAQGGLKTCLYDHGVLDLRAMLRSGQPDEDIQKALLGAIGRRPKDGFEAEAARGGEPVLESMSTIGG